MKICAISDLHGFLPELKPCDLVIICGDSIPLEFQMSSRRTKKWYSNTFAEWANNLSCEKVIFIAGNHDMYLEFHTELYEKLFSKNNKITYLCNSEYDYHGYKIYGTPCCQVFGNWAFMFSDDILKNKFKNIPKNLDILITHDAPYGVSDILLQKEYKWCTGEHIGNKILTEAILEKEPKIVLHGHLHSTNHEFESLGKSKVINCSIKDEFYNPIYEPLYFEI